MAFPRKMRGTMGLQMAVTRCKHKEGVLGPGAEIQVICGQWQPVVPSPELVP